MESFFVLHFMIIKISGFSRDQRPEIDVYLPPETTNIFTSTFARVLWLRHLEISEFGIMSK